MDIDRASRDFEAITEKVLQCAFRVANVLGHGYLEKVYENALAIELRLAGLTVEQQARFEVLYRDEVVGEYCPDLIVEGTVVLEVKALRALVDANISQCLNYLRVTGHRVGLILNFGTPRIQYRRVLFDS